MSKLIALLVFSSFLFGCSSTVPVKTVDNEIRGDKVLKVALLADSQFVSEKSKYFRPETIWNRQKSDPIANVTLRTVVQNAYSKNSLERLVSKVIKEDDLDMILYLGDGANSGCRDELVKLFNILSEYKDIPIFFLIGNHDYLAAGNTANIKTRNLLCSSNPYEKVSKKELNENVLTKYDAIIMIRDFNSKSIDLLKSKGYSFQDNYTDSLKNICDSNGVKQHNVPDCFYSAYISNDVVELFLLDTSNYSSNELPSFNDHQLAGVNGAICCDSGDHGQWAWLEGIRPISSPEKRMLFASHYPLKNLNEFRPVRNKRETGFRRQWFDKSRYNKKKTNSAVRPLAKLTSKLSSIPVWLSAHTHVNKNNGSELRWLKKVRRDRLKKIKVFEHYNVGSTTDYKQHALVVELMEAGSVSKPVYLIEEGGYMKSTCTNIINRVSSYIKKSTSIKHLKKYSSPLSLIGMTTEYRDWTLDEIKTVKTNLETIERELSLSDEDKTCLIYSASYNEYHAPGIFN